ncbi:adiponectin receptor protein 1-like [Anas platyrhynchos]|uniref:adiponectin receptor protein 1-like n=1 Tax=Anas platyrhynchos TaxID=8839 RepID=UPI003AF24C69
MRTCCVALLLLLAASTQPARCLLTDPSCLHLSDLLPAKLKELRMKFEEIKDYFQSQDDELSIQLLSSDLLDEFKGNFGCQSVLEMMRFYMEEVLPSAIRSSEHHQQSVGDLGNLLLSLKAMMRRCVWEGRWRVIPYDVLPDWLKDNDYLLHGHRPPMPSFRACFKSIFRIHTETGNIWTHLLGFVLFLCLGILTMLRPNMYFMAPLQEKVVFGMFFLGAVLCLSFSWLFHTVYCHSEKVSRTFSNSSGTVVCEDRDPGGCGSRGVFLGLGLSGVVPTMHFTIAEGFVKATTVGQMGWFFLMAVMYITGAGLYAARIPERFFPGKFDIWFQSHQIFHVLVVAAAFVHFYGVSNLQEFRYGLEGGCTDDSLL